MFGFLSSRFSGTAHLGRTSSLHMLLVFVCPWLAALAQTGPNLLFSAECVTADSTRVGRPAGPIQRPYLPHRWPVKWRSVGSGTSHNGSSTVARSKHSSSKCLKHPELAKFSHLSSPMYRTLQLHHPMFSCRSWSFFWIFGHSTSVQSGHESRVTRKRSRCWT